MAYSKLEVEKSDNIGLETELRFLPAQGRAQLCNILNSDSGKLYYISYKCMFFYYIYNFEIYLHLYFDFYH